MKNSVKKLTNLFVTAFVILVLGSCAQEDKTAVKPTPLKSSMSAQSLSALVDLYQGKYTEANWQKFQSSYQKLSLDELLKFRELQLTRQSVKAKGARISAEMVAQDAENYTGIYQQALSETGVALNRMSPEQQDAFFTKLEKSEVSASNARIEQAQAHCSVIQFNSLNGIGYQNPDNYHDWLGVELVDPGGKDDCDCEIQFRSNYRYGRVLSPIQVKDRLLAIAFNDRISGRHMNTGVQYISTAVFGRDRMWVVYGHVNCTYLGFTMNSLN